MERAHMADYLTGADQNIPDWLVKTAFPGEVEIEVKLGIKPWFGDLA